MLALLVTHRSNRSGVQKNREFQIAYGGGSLNLLDQLSRDPGDLFECSGLVKEEIRPDCQASLTILGDKDSSCNENMRMRIVRRNGTEDVETAATGHQVENQYVGLHFLNAVCSLRDIVGLTHELGSRYFLGQVCRAFHLYFGVIDNERLSSLPFSRIVRPRLY